MNYPSEAKSLVDTKQTKSDEIYNRLSQCNSFYISGLSQLEDKLHKFLDRRQPQKPANEAIPNPGDFYGSVSQQLDFFESHNQYLHRLIDHLSEIV